MAISLSSALRGKTGKTTASLAPGKKKAGINAKPPAGYYGPELDAAERAAGRGVGDLRIDTDTANERASSAYVTNTGRINQDRGFSLADLLTGKNRGHADLRTGRDRSLQDLGTTENRGRQDAGLATTALGRRFQQLAQGQAGAAVASGAAGGGTFAAALKARRENQGLEQAEIDRALSRLLQDTGTQRGRIGQDFTTSSSRLAEDYRTGVTRTNVAADRGLEDEGTNYQYGVSDRGLALQRAERENLLFGQDTAEQRNFQAAQAGYQPPKKPGKKKKGKK